MKEKVQPRYFDGFKFVRISDLPAHQAMLFSGWTLQTGDLKVPVDFSADKKDIVSYEDYDFWFDYHYLPEKDMDEQL